MNIIYYMYIKRLSTTKDSRTKYALPYYPSLEDSNAMYLTVLVQSLQVTDTKIVSNTKLFY